MHGEVLGGILPAIENRKGTLEMNDPRGSVWRKWDLHVHTPASFHWKGGKRFSGMTAAEKEAALDEMVQKFNQSDVASFAIMDYWTFDGYWALRDYLVCKGEDVR